MLRFLFDPLGDWHNDLVMKVDGLPSMAKVIDSHYLSGFLGIGEADETEDARRNVVLRYVEFVMEQITSVNGQARFIPVDLSDEYVGGLLVNTAQRGLLSLKYVWSDATAGFAMDSKHELAGIDWKEEGEWELPREAVLEGLKWSKRTIRESHE